MPHLSIRYLMIEGVLVIREEALRSDGSARHGTCHHLKGQSMDSLRFSSIALVQISSNPYVDTVGEYGSDDCITDPSACLWGESPGRAYRH